MMKAAILALALLAVPVAAQADNIVIPLPGGAKPETIEANYDCGAFGQVSASYINAPPVALATLSFKGQFLVLSNVLSGSGARYAAGPYIWWSKGRGADLYDLTKGEDAPPIASCTEK
jgi:membrane-bound inhibitor of C-type lysozyme